MGTQAADRLDQQARRCPRHLCSPPLLAAPPRSQTPPPSSAASSPNLRLAPPRAPGCRWRPNTTSPASATPPSKGTRAPRRCRRPFLAAGSRGRRKRGRPRRRRPGAGWAVCLSVWCDGAIAEGGYWCHGSPDAVPLSSCRVRRGRLQRGRLPSLLLAATRIGETLTLGCLRLHACFACRESSLGPLFWCGASLAPTTRRLACCDCLVCHVRPGSRVGVRGNE